MLQMEQAIETAREALPRAFPESASLETRLEAAEKTEDERFWQVTFSYPRNDWSVVTNVREYRTIKLRSADGEVMGVRNGFLTAA